MPAAAQEVDIDEVMAHWAYYSDDQRHEIVALSMAGEPWKAQEGPQEKLLECVCDEIFFGGARGGGKSFGILLDWYFHQKKYGSKANGIIVRRTTVELEELIEESKVVYGAVGARYQEQKKTWHFPGGARMKFRHLEKDSHASKYQGHAYTWLGVEEAGSFPKSDPIDKMRATLRSVHGVPIRMVLTGNPGGAGHNWLKQRYIDPCPPNVVNEIDVEIKPGVMLPWRRIFIPSKLEDNKLLIDNDPRYVINLAMSGPAWLVKAWLAGDWNIVAGGMYDDLFAPDVMERIVLPWFKVPSTWRIDRSFDWGSSRPFSVGWWAEANGDPVNVPWQKSPLFLPRGSVLRIAEWYGWNGTANTGIEYTTSQIAAGILKREKKMGYRVHAGPADASIFHGSPDEPSIAKKLKAKKAGFISAGNNAFTGRVRGWEHMRDMLVAAVAADEAEPGAFMPREEPGLFIMDNCRQWLRTVPYLPRDETNPDDVDTEAEDHIADETRYRVCRKRYKYRHRGLN